jgi:AcrR family transcriptional regulator
VLASVSSQSVEAPADQYEQLILDVVMSAADIEMSAEPNVFGVRLDSSLTVQSRREVILASAIKMFAERGYHEVGTDAIGAVVGLSGPGIY